MNTAVPKKAKSPRKGVAKTFSEVSDSAAKSDSWPEILATDKTPLIGTIGIELCAQPPGLCYPKNEDVDHALADAYASVVSALLDKEDFSVNACHGDFNSVEVSSKILRNWGEVRTFYDTVTRLTTAVGCTPHSQHHTSGGGHIHVGDLSVGECVNILRVLQNRPWISWVFNDPDDDRSANSFCDSLESMTMVKRVSASDFTEDEDDFDDRAEYRAAAKKWAAEQNAIADKGGSNALIDAATKLNVDLSVLLSGASLDSKARTALTFYANPVYVDRKWLPSDKSGMLRWVPGYKTLEFRFFQAPLDWNEQMAHLKFVEALILWVRRELKDVYEVTNVSTEKQLQDITLEKAQAGFLSFLDVLGLPHKPYARMLVENLPDRFKRGVRK